MPIPTPSRAARAAAVLLMLGSARLVLAQRDGSKDSESEAIRQEKAWSEAFLHNDTAAIGRILADEFVGVDGRGVISHKAEELEEARTHDPKTMIESEALDQFEPRAYGETVVLRARNTVRMHAGPDIREIQYRRTTVWVKRDGRLQCVAFHASRIQTPPPGSATPTPASVR